MRRIGSVNARTAWISPMAQYAYPMIEQKGVDEIGVADVRAVIAGDQEGRFQKGWR